MNNWSRRETLMAIAGVLAATVLKAPDYANAQEALGENADFDALESEFSTFFGNAEGPYLQHYLIDSNDPRITVDTWSIYDQFAAIFYAGPAERDEQLPNGMRMVVRFLPHNAMYKAIVILEPDGVNVATAAMTFYRCPAAGIDEPVASQLTHFVCENHLSLAIFHRGRRSPETIDPIRQFFAHYPMPTEQRLAPILGQDKVRVSVYAKQLA